ncbi:MAG: methyltransferase domain-containing protein [Actinobacteria bacterium]|nr:MAG: methyltransferase domain-containing protein [Actinomycetota bacterium]
MGVRRAAERLHRRATRAGAACALDAAGPERPPAGARAARHRVLRPARQPGLPRRPRLLGPAHRAAADRRVAQARVRCVRESCAAPLNHGTLALAHEACLSPDHRCGAGARSSRRRKRQRLRRHRRQRRVLRQPVLPGVAVRCPAVGRHRDHPPDAALVRCRDRAGQLRLHAVRSLRARGGPAQHPGAPGAVRPAELPQARRRQQEVHAVPEVQRRHGSVRRHRRPALRAGRDVLELAPRAGRPLVQRLPDLERAESAGVLGRPPERRGLRRDAAHGRRRDQSGAAGRGGRDRGAPRQPPLEAQHLQVHPADVLGRRQGDVRHARRQPLRANRLEPDLQAQEDPRDHDQERRQRVEPVGDRARLVGHRTGIRVPSRQVRSGQADRPGAQGAQGQPGDAQAARLLLLRLEGRRRLQGRQGLLGPAYGPFAQERIAQARIRGVQEGRRSAVSEAPAAMSRLERLFHATEEENRRAVLRMLPSGRGGALLDVGTHEGDFAARVAQRVGATRVAGIDFVAEHVEAARARGIEVVCANIDDGLPFADEEFETVHANQVIEHVRRSDAFMREVRRVLKPGGLALISTNNFSSWHNVGALALGYQPMPAHVSDELILGNPLDPLRGQPHEDGRAHLRLFTARALTELSVVHGLEPVQVRTAGYYPLPPRLGRIMARIDKLHGAFLVALVRRPL